MERRKFMRFLITLRVGAKRENKENSFGLVKDFSREGLRVVFDDFDFDLNSCVDLKIQRLSEDIFIPASGEVVWKRPVEGKWEAGLRLKEFPSSVKAEILESGYRKWLEERATV
jgi:hypothetical protein